MHETHGPCMPTLLLEEDHALGAVSAWLLFKKAGVTGRCYRQVAVVSVAIVLAKFDATHANASASP